MGLFSFHYEKKSLLLIITGLMYALNFRMSFKNIEYHMDTSCYSSVKYDPLVILIKNIVNIFFIFIYCYEQKISKVTFETYELISQKYKDDSPNISSIQSDFLLTKKETTKSELSFNDVSTTFVGAKTKVKKFTQHIKCYFYILVIYISEEAYFIIDNNHIIDRVIVNIRNFLILIFLLLFSPLIIRRSTYIYRHQLISCIIIMTIAIIIVFFNIFGVERFKKIHGYNLLLYCPCFFLMGLQFTLIKYLLSIEFVSMYFMIFLKGVFGTIIFAVINILYSSEEFFNFLDKILSFEYEYMYEEFPVIQKIGYILTLIILQYLIIFTINTFSHNHIIISIMLSELFYFVLYLIERFSIQKLGISNPLSFAINTIICAINILLMLVFNEFLECKFWGLNVNLQRNINKRQNEDYRKGKRELYMQLQDEKEQEQQKNDNDNDTNNTNNNEVDERYSNTSDN